MTSLSTSVSPDSCRTRWITLRRYSAERPQITDAAAQAIAMTARMSWFMVRERVPERSRRADAEPVTERHRASVPFPSSAGQPGAPLPGRTSVPDADPDLDGRGAEVEL